MDGTMQGGSATEARGRAPVGMSVRSQAAPSHAIAGKIRTAPVLRSVGIGLLQEVPRRYSSLRLDSHSTVQLSKARAPCWYVRQLGATAQRERTATPPGNRVSGGSGKRNRRSPSSG